MSSKILHSQYLFILEGQRTGGEDDHGARAAEIRQLAPNFQVVMPSDLTIDGEGEQRLQTQVPD